MEDNIKRGKNGFLAHLEVVTKSNHGSTKTDNLQNTKHLHMSRNSFTKSIFSTLLVKVPWFIANTHINDFLCIFLGYAKHAIEFQVIEGGAIAPVVLLHT